MKNILFVIIALLFIGCIDNPEKTANDEFVELSKDKEFIESHDEPNDVQAKLVGSMIKISVEGQEDANAYFIKSKMESNQYLFLIHEWWGLNDFVKLHGDRMYEELGDVNVIALDLYDGNVATTRENAMEYMKEAEESRINSIINAGIVRAGENAEIATIGWCFGGGWSLKTALSAGDNTIACIMFYGMPVDNVEELKQLNSDVLFIYGKQDQWINEEVANTFEVNMKLAGKRLVVKAYDADHAFANPSSEHYIEEAAKNANREALNFIYERSFGIRTN